MVPFAGWSMPIQYKESIMDSSIHCRKDAALFDVAHMCGASFRVSTDVVNITCSYLPGRFNLCFLAVMCMVLSNLPMMSKCHILFSMDCTSFLMHAAQGKDAIELLESLIVGDIASLDDRTGTLSVFTNEKGGIIDDSVITKVGCGVSFGLLLHQHLLPNSLQ